MIITKRNGTKTEFNPNKIRNRIKKQSVNLNIDTDKLFFSVMKGIADDMTTKQIDDLIAETSASMTMIHPDYSILAGNICISRLHKETEDDIMKVYKKLYKADALDEDFYENLKTHYQDIKDKLDYTKDYGVDYFGWTRLQEVYLLKLGDEVVERPQQMFMRVALTIHKKIEDILELYYELSNKYISKATPILINAGTDVKSLISCNLTFNKGDTTEDLLKTINNIAVSSSRAEGIGLAMHNIRSKESSVGKGSGKAGGLLKYIKVVNEALRFWNQKGKRPGAAAIYLEPWHKDVFDLLDIRKNTGKEELRARDLFSAMWTCDLFMEAVEKDSDWHLFCPNDIKKAGLRPFYELYGEDFKTEYNKAVELGIGKKIKAQDLWYKICESQIETGIPYIGFKDHVNRKSAQKNIGTIKSSNLCLSEDTVLDVIIDEKNEKIDIKTCIELLKIKDIFVKSYDIKTNTIEYQKITNGALMSKKAEVLEIIDDETGKKIICTPEHKIFTKNRGYVMAKDLLESDNLCVDF